MDELWKDIDGYEGFYQVSNLGRIKALERVDSNNRRHKERILHQPMNPNGYLHVHLSRENKARWLLSHRLVAMAFVEKKEGCDIVNHLDNNPKNNRADNLEWTTYQGNMQWAAKQGRMKGSPENFAKAREKRKCSVIVDAPDNKKMVFASQAEAARVLGISRHHIAAACRKEYGYKTIKGYQFEYADEEKRKSAIPKKIGLSKGECIELTRKRMMGNTIMVGRKLSEETKRKIGEASAKKVSQYTENGMFIATYKSIKEAKKKTGVHHIADVANRTRKTAGGYVWKWGE